jgi:hypothetical protein
MSPILLSSSDNSAQDKQSPIKYYFKLPYKLSNINPNQVLKDLSVMTFDYLSFHNFANKKTIYKK